MRLQSSRYCRMLTEHTSCQQLECLFATWWLRDWLHWRPRQTRDKMNEGLNTAELGRSCALCISWSTLCRHVASLENTVIFAQKEPKHSSISELALPRSTSTKEYAETQARNALAVHVFLYRTCRHVPATRFVGYAYLPMHAILYHRHEAAWCVILQLRIRMQWDTIITIWRQSDIDWALKYLKFRIQIGCKAVCMNDCEVLWNGGPALICTVSKQHWSSVQETCRVPGVHQHNIHHCTNIPTRCSWQYVKRL